jgi:transposase-like protein
MDKIIRIFSDEFKSAQVKEIEQGKMSISQLSRLYDVSRSAIYQWLYQYGNKYKKGIRMVVEKESESARTLAMAERVSELERLLGQKQIEIEYLNRVIVEGDKLLGCDLKKKYVPKF